MSTSRTWSARLFAMFGRPRQDAELSVEISSHLDQLRANPAATLRDE